MTCTDEARASVVADCAAAAGDAFTCATAADSVSVAIAEACSSGRSVAGSGPGRVLVNGDSLLDGLGYTAGAFEAARVASIPEGDVAPDFAPTVASLRGASEAAFATAALAACGPPLSAELNPSLRPLERRSSCSYVVGVAVLLVAVVRRSEWCARAGKKRCHNRRGPLPVPRARFNEHAAGSSCACVRSTRVPSGRYERACAV